MKAAESYALAQKIIKKCDGSRDPEVIYQCLGIELEDTFDLANLKGMYSSADRHRTIYLHKRLTGYLRRFVAMIRYPNIGNGHDGCLIKKSSFLVVQINQRGRQTLSLRMSSLMMRRWSI